MFILPPSFPPIPARNKILKEFKKTKTKIHDKEIVPASPRLRSVLRQLVDPQTDEQRPHRAIKARQWRWLDSAALCCVVIN